MAEEETYCATPLGVMSSVLPLEQAQAAWDAVELHMRRHYGPIPGIVLDGASAYFTKLEPAQDSAWSGR